MRGDFGETTVPTTLTAGTSDEASQGAAERCGSVRVLVLCLMPVGRSPAQRFRFEQYLGALSAAGVRVDLAPFFDSGTSSILYMHGSKHRKVMGVLSGVLGRLRVARRFRAYDRIIIYRDAVPIGPPIIEWLAFHSGVPVVYDFDDAIFIRNVSEANRMIGWLKFPSKVGYVTRRSERVIVCNEYLRDWARRLNKDVVVVPTTVDLNYHRSTRDRSQSACLPIIGWTGSHSTAPYLDLLRPALRALQDQREFEFRVICDKDPGFPELKNYSYLPWRAETEISDLDTFDIGVMPVPDGPWERGKVGFKAIQYGAMEIPAVVSVTGSGGDVVKHGVTGFVVGNTAEAWRQSLDALLSDRAKAARMGREAKLRVAARYSTDAQRDAYIKIFKGLA